MSHAMPPTVPPPGNTRPPSAFLEAIISLLMPYFIATATDIGAARSEIIDTLATYATRTRAELLKAAQIIAFGMSVLDTLADAKAISLSPSLRIRFRGCANNLNRSAQQQQDGLHRLLACDVPETDVPQADAPQAAAPMSQPVSASPDTAIQDAIGAARNTIQAYRNSLFARRPVADMDAVPPRDPQRHGTQIWAGAFMDTLRQAGFAHHAAQGG